MKLESIMFISNISNSRSNIIDLCLKKYDFRYNKHLPGFGSKNEEALNFGSYIHKIFERGYENSTTERLLEIAKEESQKYKIKKNFLDKTKICIENFVRWNNNLGKTVGVEWNYETVLDKKNDITQIGIIDRIIEGNNGGMLVIDYKTSKKEKKMHDLLMDKQMQGYAYAVHKKFNIPLDKILCTHYYPVTGHLVQPVRYNQSQINNWKKREIDKVWRIRKKKKDEFPAQRNIFCPWCEFLEICPKFHTEQEIAPKLVEQLKLAAENKRLREEAKKKS